MLLNVSEEVEPLLFSGSGGFALEVGKCPLPDYTRVIKNLPYDFAPSFWITPQLAFDKCRHAKWIDKQYIRETSLSGIELHADRNKWAKRWVELLDWHRFRMREDEVPNPSLIIASRRIPPLK
ncbi:hypothetical protein GCM10007887_31800 [Methylobacterium haplocladii]|uniref:Uncharacterized protein n=1 Tax=Methylobacterium haplocladii TaxID=1176176 RepID=A0A512ITP0_9HYPH|nr:hypothetical protein MHA02_34480 [Methylobacterium haplocladii]GLS60501.1 hypothetical protein GCM10007887_31800 [Methylobacterium haplocladii]